MDGANLTELGEITIPPQDKIHRALFNGLAGRNIDGTQAADYAGNWSELTDPNNPIRNVLVDRVSADIAADIAADISEKELREVMDAIYNLGKQIGLNKPKPNEEAIQVELDYLNRVIRAGEDPISPETYNRCRGIIDGHLEQLVGEIVASQQSGRFDDVNAVKLIEAIAPSGSGQLTTERVVKGLLRGQDAHTIASNNNGVNENSWLMQTMTGFVQRLQNGENIQVSSGT